MQPADRDSLVLSIFPGIDLFGMAFEQEGFCVVRGPDVLWGGDVRRFNPPAGVFAGVIGGPPCKEFSPLAHLVRANGGMPKFGNLIPEFERCVAEAAPAWFLMENVPQAPVPTVPGYGTHHFVLDNAALGEEQRRKRRFSFGLRGERPVDLRRWIEYAALQPPVHANSVTSAHADNSHEAKGRVQAPTLADHGPAPGQRGPRIQVGAVRTGPQRSSPSVRMARYTIEEACRLQGVPEDFLREAPFTKHAKRQVIANGVPIVMGRAIARAIQAAVCPEIADEPA